MGHAGARGGDVRPTPAGPFCNVASLKKFAKVVARRFGISLSMAHEHLARAAGHDDWQGLQAAIAKDGVCVAGVEEVSLRAWSGSLRQALGADFEELMLPAELETWWRRLCVQRPAAMPLGEATKAEAEAKRAAAALLGTDAAEKYLTTPNFALGGRRPVDLLAAPGGLAVVLGELHCQKEGGPL